MAFEIITIEGSPDGPPPPRLWPFVWHFVRQIKGLLVILLVLEACVAAGSTMIPVMIGWLVNDINGSAQTRDVLSHPWLWRTAAPILIGWGVGMALLWYIYDHYYTARFNNLIRYQLARYTLGHSMAYFTNDFAGRLANKVVDGGAALRDPLRSAISAIWYCGFFVFASTATMMRFDFWLAAPTLVWLAAFIASLVYFLPRVRALQLAHARHHTELVGHVNDVFVNIGLVKLFGREADETASNLSRTPPAHRQFQRCPAQDLADGRDPYRDERRAAAGRAGAGAGAMAGGADYLRGGDHGDPDDLADGQHVGLDPQRGHQCVRDAGARRGMHGDDRAALFGGGCARRPPAEGASTARSNSAPSASITAAAAGRATRG